MTKIEAFTPLISIYRSSVLEVTFSGIIAVVNGQGKVLLQTGDIDRFLWTRSVLKPLQLLSHLDLLKKSYPELKPEHLALMSSSHSGEPQHLKLLEEIMEIGDIDPSDLKCPASMPLDPDRAALLRHDHIEPCSSFHNCSGKHAGYLLAIKAQASRKARSQPDPHLSQQAMQLAMSNYLDPQGEHFEPLIDLLSLLSGRDQGLFIPTVDGCRLPNYALSSREIAQTYCALTKPLPDSVFASRISKYPGSNQASWQEPANLMAQYPEVIGGTNRLDTRIMQGKLFDSACDGKVIAKQGAEGLLAIGLEEADGLGILIKLASGWDARAMEIVAINVFELLGLKDKAVSDKESAHIETRVHFSLEQAYGNQAS